MFDLSITKLLFLAVIALVIFGPNELPKIARQTGKMLRDLRRIAEGARDDLREGLGPEFQDFDFEDLNPRRFVRKHLLDDEEMAATQRALFGDSGTAPHGADSGDVPAVAGGAATAGGSAAVLPDGAEPPFDMEAT